MCLSCGCHQPTNSHGDPRHITLADLQASADAAGIDPVQAADNLVDTVADLVISAPDDSLPEYAWQRQ